MAGDDFLEEEAAYLAHRILGCVGHVRRTPQGPRAENVLKFPTPALPGSGSKGHSLTRETLSPSGLPALRRSGRYMNVHSHAGRIGLGHVTSKAFKEKQS